MLNQISVTKRAGQRNLTNLFGVVKHKHDDGKSFGGMLLKVNEANISVTPRTPLAER
jgi:hypothetical protein